MIFLLTCWFIWRSRNEEVFNDYCLPPWSVINSIKSEYVVSSQVYGAVQIASVTWEVVWTPPIGDTIQVNVDGSSSGNPGHAGFGG